MKIALDYDLTYSADKVFWNNFIHMASFRDDVKIYIVTARHPVKDELSNEQVHPSVRAILEDIIYCNGVAKKWHLHHNHDLDIDVWIDDNPNNIMNNSSASKEFLVEWRNSEEYKS